MQVIYAYEPAPATFTKSLFLAGPTPRSSDVPSWRPEAIKLLDSIGYSGVVFVPEPRNGVYSSSYVQQVEWEQQHLNMSDIVVFWVPRKMNAGMPALTTNVEYGLFYKTGKIVYGRPDDADNCRYLDHMYKERYGVSPASTLAELMDMANQKLKGEAARELGERCIPLSIWNTNAFAAWINLQKAAGNTLFDAKVLNTVYVANGKFLFSFAIHVNIWVEEEQRYKENEFIVSRPDISTIVAYYVPADSKSIDDTKVLLIKEFRSTVRNEEAMVYEVPGGSSFKQTDDVNKVAADELFEETGIQVDPGRLRYIGSKQINATFSTHHGHVFSVSLTDEEWATVEQDVAKGGQHGVAEDGERTYLIACTVRELKEGRYPVDWANLGMIYSCVL